MRFSARRGLLITFSNAQNVWNGVSTKGALTLHQGLGDPWTPSVSDFVFKTVVPQPEKGQALLQGRMVCVLLYINFLCVLQEALTAGIEMYKKATNGTKEIKVNLDTDHYLGNEV